MMESPESKTLMSRESDSFETAVEIKSGRSQSQAKILMNRKNFIIISLLVIVLLLIIGMFVMIIWSQNENEIPAKAKEICYSKECIGLAAMMKNYKNEAIHPCDNFFEHTCGRFHEHQNLDKSFLEVQTEVLVNHIFSSVRKSSKFSTHPHEQLRIFARKCLDRKEKFLDTFEELMLDIETNGGFPFINHDWDEKTFDLSEMLASYIKINRNRLGFLSVEPFAIISNGKVENRIFVSPGPHWTYNWRMGIDNYKEGIRFVLERLLKLKNQTLDVATYNLEFEKLSKLEATFHKLSNFKNANRGSTETFRNLTDLIKAVPEIDWLKIISAMSRDPENAEKLLEKVAVSGEDYFFGAKKELSRIATETPKSVLANYLIFRHLLDVSLHFYEKDQPGTHKYYGYQSLTSFCAHQLVFFFPMLSQSIFLHDQPENGEKIKKNLEIAEKMFLSVRAEFSEIIEESTWMEKTSKEKALLKLEKMTVNLGFREFFQGERLDRMYETLNFLETDSVYQIYKKMWRHRTEQLVEHVVFDTRMDPVSMNIFRPHAGYLPFVNHLGVMLPYLVYPFLDDKYPSSANYGYLGYVFGHEMGHAFDETYRKLNEEGKSENWWTEASNSEYEKREKCLRDQYSEWVEPGYDFQMNGTIPRKELFADNVGIISGFRAFQKAVKHDETILPGMQNLTDEQQFFYSYAMKFCDVYNPQSTREELLHFSHPTMRFRINGVLRNLPEFSQAFHCPNGSYMKLEEQEQCRIF